MIQWWQFYFSLCTQLIKSVIGLTIVSSAGSLYSLVSLLVLIMGDVTTGCLSVVTLQLFVLGVVPSVVLLGVSTQLLVRFLYSSAFSISQGIDTKTLRLQQSLYQ